MQLSVSFSLLPVTFTFNKKFFAMQSPSWKRQHEALGTWRRKVSICFCEMNIFLTLSATHFNAKALNLNKTIESSKLWAKYKNNPFSEVGHPLKANYIQVSVDKGNQKAGKFWENKITIRQQQQQQQQFISPKGRYESYLQVIRLIH